MDVEGYTFLVEDRLFQEVAPIRIDFNHHYGFNVASRLKTGGSGCSSCSSCG